LDADDGKNILKIPARPVFKEKKFFVCRLFESGTRRE
jgi:hypothetical protein